jgi:hypothetical protein
MPPRCVDSSADGARRHGSGVREMNDLVLPARRAAPTNTTEAAPTPFPGWERLDQAVASGLRTGRSRMAEHELGRAEASAGALWERPAGS